MKFDEEFNKFIKKCYGNSYVHLVNDDENDGKKLRQFVEDNYIHKQKVREAIDILSDNSYKDIVKNELGLE